MATTEWTGTDPDRVSGDPDGLYAGTAGLPSRAAAMAIDYVVLLASGAAIAAATHLAGLTGGLGQVVATLATSAAIALYFAVLESSTSQGTLGKIVLGLQVTDDEGRPISFGRALGRTLAKLLSLLPFGLGFLMAAFADRNRTLHDRLAGTLVQRVH